MSQEDSPFTQIDREPFLARNPLNGQQEKFRADMLQLFIEFFCQEQSLDLRDLIESLEKCIIVNALLKADGSQKQAAKALGVKYTTLNEKIKRYNIRFEKYPVGGPELLF